MLKQRPVVRRALFPIDFQTLLGSCRASLCAYCANRALGFHPLSSCYMERLERACPYQSCSGTSVRVALRGEAGLSFCHMLSLALAFMYVENGLRL